MSTRSFRSSAWRTLLSGLFALALALALHLLTSGTARAAPIDQVPTPPFQAVTTAAMNVRAGPSTNTAIVGTLATGESFTVVGIAPGEEVLAGNISWFQMSGGGFVYSGYAVPSGGSASSAGMTGRWIEVDRVAQVARAMENGQVVYTAPVVVGVPAYPTPVGRFEVLRRVRNETMNSATIGINPDAPDGYFLEDVLFTQYITDTGVALHYNYWSPRGAFGNWPTSHGCVGLQLEDARFFWNFATVGTPVIITR